MEFNQMYEKFLKRLNEILEYQWNDYDIKIREAFDDVKGVEAGEDALEAIARHMVEVLNENNKMEN